ncbi:L-threonylcarbamoyladenylate synthase [Rheinheimera sp.]|jgi:L-threonylcarbamoyladenylate synthase|uniref:L-threonylcarbamoyladenylate synthase n=1 Tax=Rheinheimera sp. TaxID=1869214 RepID=UPI00261CA6F5|nr:L-threonylcarbamoyladenylate synthase [Rheinheimera sp.]MCA1929363.1 threonylcarbamoyl-AMP synthase [Rheinheimera sp.]
MVLNTLMLHSEQAKDRQIAAELLKQGKLVAVPTETVYGLAADARNKSAVNNIFVAKGRPSDHPLIVHMHAASAMHDWAQDIPAEAFALAQAFWPGPLTLLLKKADHVDTVVTGGLDTIGLRVPSHPVLLNLLVTHQLAVAAPSANPYKQLSPTSARQVMETMAGKLDAVLDGGDCQFGLESTIVSLVNGAVQVLRAGPVSVAQLEAVLKQKVQCPLQHQVKVSGNVAAHYQPKTRLRCVSAGELDELLKDTTQLLAVLSFSDLSANTEPHWHCSMPTNAQDFGRVLYKQLYLADQSGAELIVLEMPPLDDQWAAVQNRLMRAAYQED